MISLRLAASALVAFCLVISSRAISRSSTSVLPFATVLAKLSSSAGSTFASEEIAAGQAAHHRALLIEPHAEGVIRDYIRARCDELMQDRGLAAARRPAECDRAGHAGQHDRCHMQHDVAPHPEQGRQCRRDQIARNHASDTPATCSTTMRSPASHR